MNIYKAINGCGSLTYVHLKSISQIQFDLKKGSINLDYSPISKNRINLSIIDFKMN